MDILEFIGEIKERPVAATVAWCDTCAACGRRLEISTDRKRQDRWQVDLVMEYPTGRGTHWLPWCVQCLFPEHAGKPLGRESWIAPVGYASVLGNRLIAASPDGASLLVRWNEENPESLVTSYSGPLDPGKESARYEQAAEAVRICVSGDFYMAWHHLANRGWCGFESASLEECHQFAALPQSDRYGWITYDPAIRSE